MKTHVLLLALLGCVGCGSMPAMAPPAPPPRTCKLVTEACTKLSDCCSSPAMSCDRATKRCVPAASLALAQPCASDSQCLSGDCFGGACAQTCTANAQCSHGTLCSATYGECVPACGASEPTTDCTFYGNALTCQVDTSLPVGSTIHACLP